MPIPTDSVVSIGLSPRFAVFESRVVFSCCRVLKIYFPNWYRRACISDVEACDKVKDLESKTSNCVTIEDVEAGFRFYLTELCSCNCVYLGWSFCGVSDCKSALKHWNNGTGAQKRSNHLNRSWQFSVLTFLFSILVVRWEYRPRDRLEVPSIVWNQIHMTPMI
jgi:hypothetical protein